MEISFAIVGTAGRKDDASKLSKKHFEAMCITASGLIDQCNKSGYPITHLVSGGAAWADHVAVKLFLDKKVPHLLLFIPCKFVGGSYEDEFRAEIPFHGKKGNQRSIGGTMNYYHQRFKIVTGINSLSQIQTAKNEGAELLPCRGGFYGRNAMVAKSDFILAMTFGNKRLVKEGGTADTIRRYLMRVVKEGIFDKSFHYDLNIGELFIGCNVLPKEEKN
jgi:hypothetical protein